VVAAVLLLLLGKKMMLMAKVQSTGRRFCLEHISLCKSVQ
jgi:hypothetical protein